jgi:UDP-glucose 4-epimerase
VYNVGSEDQLSARRIGEVVVEEMGLGSVSFTFSGGDGGRGWAGDVKNMLLDTTKLRSEGWTPKHNSEAAVRLGVREIIGRRMLAPRVVA